MGKIKRYEQLPMISDSDAEVFTKTTQNNSFMVDDSKFKQLIKDVQDVEKSYPCSSSYIELKSITDSNQPVIKKNRLVSSLVAHKINQP
jgi:hypothetical protein